ncbi:MAG: sodium:proton antiporter [Flavobacteriales bacterium]|nr:sodium:proton antiporter [Flavobacteriales bacterium]|tara:strand:+ start:40976 stop:42409 length:1434 start_codon:yes stop_codon:yes gene_type:complete
MNESKINNIVFTIFPFVILIILLGLNLFLFDNAMKGPNQLALIISALIGFWISNLRGSKNYEIINGIKDSILSSLNAIIILCIIGGLTSTWILSGVVPAMIYYGIELINPNFFLFTSCIICAIVSISTGSSWTTAATIGIAFISIGELLGVSKGLIAGAIISGAYFGDKMSPLSETTNLAPSVSGSNLIEHIKYMTYTTIPTILITLLLFFIIGLKSKKPSVSLDEIETFLEIINTKFYVGIELFILPLIIFFLIMLKCSAQKTLFIAMIAGIIFAFIFQKELIQEINLSSGSNTLSTILKTIFLGTNIPIDNISISNLLSKSGVFGMFWIVILVISAMIFGGVMHSGRFLKKITDLILSNSASNFKLIRSTASSCVFFNFATCDQYLAIVIPGRMFKEVYQDNDLHPTNLSRTIEDTGTVTSVLIPWNSCAAYHAEILSINPLSYIPYCFFNIISPFMTLFYAYCKIKIKKNEIKK